MLPMAAGFLVTTNTSNGTAQTLNPGIVDPTNTYAGKTYSELAAGWWQHYMSLPTTNNPFVYILNHPIPLSVGQSGPVWFIAGNYETGGTHNYSNTIPAGVALFLLITDIEQDNAGCPTNDFTEAQLRTFAQTYQNDATNMTCTIDGKAVIGLTNVLNTPYRVQSTAFAYTCPPVRNVLHDLAGDSCYQNALGSDYTIPLAVEDGVFLLLSPLSAGHHVIHVTGAYIPGNFTENWTHYLTVQPVPLSVEVDTQPGQLRLTWQDSPDIYTLESSPVPNSTNWQASSASVVLSNGTFQVIVPTAQTNQFFRLRIQ